MRFCGTRGGEGFLTALRPVETVKNEKSTWNCPDGTVACSSKTSPTNTICISSNRETFECPITDMKFVKHSAIAEYKSNEDYTVQEVNDEYYFVTSKDVADNLPVTKFKVESQPCLDPNN